MISQIINNYVLNAIGAYIRSTDFSIKKLELEGCGVVDDTNWDDGAFDRVTTVSVGVIQLVYFKGEEVIIHFHESREQTKTSSYQSSETFQW